MPTDVPTRPNASRMSGRPKSDVISRLSPCGHVGHRLLRLNKATRHTAARQTPQSLHSTTVCFPANRMVSSSHNSQVTLNFTRADMANQSATQRISRACVPHLPRTTCHHARSVSGMYASLPMRTTLVLFVVEVEWTVGTKGSGEIPDRG